MTAIAVVAEVPEPAGQQPQDTDLHRRAVSLAGRLELPALTASDDVDRYEFLLRVTGSGLQLVWNQAAAPGPVQVDFDHPTLDYRIRNRVNRQAIARAVGIKPGLNPAVLDATAGLGKDAYLLASAGCSVRLLERDPVVHALLEDGLQRARQAEDGPLREAALRMELSLTSLAEFQAEAAAFEVVYLDPMFPARSKSARVKKDMYVLQQFFRGGAGRDEENALLQQALSIARRRVVVKRPARAADLAGRVPSFRLPGKSSRFDVYVTG